MKKLWKNFCLGAVAVTSVMGLSGCGKDKVATSVDLDNDGVVSEWETLFGSMAPSDRLTISNVVEINSLSDLKAINDSTETKVYKLNSNIDCGGETLSINLGQSSLYGNNKVIKNFKLGDCAIFGEGESSTTINKGLFYNGVAVYDLRLFMGNQTFSFQGVNSATTISPFVNVPVLDNVVVKGKIDVKNQSSDGDVYLSLLASSIEGKRSDMSITNCSVIGDIDYDVVSTYSVVNVGGIAPKLWTTDFVYGCDVNAELNILGTDMNIGMVAGVNEGFVSTVNSTGMIATSYSAAGYSNIGGIVGVNEKSAEIKNATTTATLNYTEDPSLDSGLSGDRVYAIGGVSGRNNGVISYSTSDATLNINKCDAKVYAGSIAGYGEHAIYYNVIGRGAVNPTGCPDIYIADLVGYSKYGYFDKVIANTNINVDNSAINSKVYLGLLTIFENLDSAFDSDAKYNAEFAPNFKSVLLGGAVNVYTNSAVSSGNFRYNLGLRNEFEYFQLDENGNMIERPVLDENGDPLLDEDNVPVTEFVTEILTPYLYDSLYILDSYTINKYKFVEGNKVLESGLNLTYAKGSKSVTSNSASVALQLNFFLRNLGFNYIIGNNEIDISSFDLSKFKFTLNKDAQLERYFSYNQKDYNGDLSTFDKYFENKCTFDITDEMFSYLNKLITSNATNSYSPLLISKTFATSRVQLPTTGEEERPEDEDVEVPEGEGGEGSTETPEVEEMPDYLTIEERFVKNISDLLQLMKITTTESKYTMDFQLIEGESGEGEDIGVQTVKYIRLYFSDNNYTYSLTFDVTEMVKDVDRLQDNYVVYMDYYKDAK